MPRFAKLFGERATAVNAQDAWIEGQRGLANSIGKQLYDTYETNGARRDSLCRENVQASASSEVMTDDAALFATPLIGRSPAMLRLFALIERIAPTDSSVLIMGATGTGKELVARSIHDLSSRRTAPFIGINCSAIPDTLVEAELFGHQRGSFTGAHETRRGLFEEAASGTLFLDEVDALSLPAQAKLLRVLQERSLRRVGGRENIPFKARVISAANRDLQQAVNEGVFRADLLFRLRVIPLHVPGLHERGEDVWLLIEHFLRKHAARRGLPLRRFAADAGEALIAHLWPGNVRELENAVEYALTIGADKELGINDLPPDVLRQVVGNRDPIKESLACKATLAEMERRYILFMLESFGGNQVKTSIALDIDRRTLHRKLKEYAMLMVKPARDYVEVVLH